jgi:hypothetical protein
MKRTGIYLLLTGILLINAKRLQAQNLLSKTVSLEVNRQRLDNVLEILSNKGDFYFSYNSTIVPKDSLVSFSVSNKTVKEVLAILFNKTYEFRESGKYIIIRKAPIRLTMVTNKATDEMKMYFVSGHVYDELSGAGIYEATVYEKELLVSALTRTDGYFKLKLKSKNLRRSSLTVSKEFYEDNTVSIDPRYNQEITITLMPRKNTIDDMVVSPQDIFIPDSSHAIAVIDTTPKPAVTPVMAVLKVERTAVGKLFVSAKQRVQTLNLKKFFTTRPFQISVVPGVGTQGWMSAQVVNNFSVNILGGYTAGTNGLEIGGLFNINKKNTQYFQGAGLFNATGGSMKGVQMAGINNLVLDSAKGLQIAGISNIVKGKFTGGQIAGIYNHAIDSVNGVQASGIGNFARKKISGMQFSCMVNFSNKQTDGAQAGGLINFSKKLNGAQIAGLLNYATDTVKGIQLAGLINMSHKKVTGTQIAGLMNINLRETKGVQLSALVNYTKRLKGIQIGLLNISDTSEGASFGLVNIVVKGYRRVSIYASEVTNINLAFKSGNATLYNILHAGLNAGNDNRVYTLGVGWGTELSINKRKTLTVNPELGTQYIYLGDWTRTNMLTTLQVNMNVKISPGFFLFAGPSFNIFVSDQQIRIPPYRYPVVPAGNDAFGWFGWKLGMSVGRN